MSSRKKKNVTKTRATNEVARLAAMREGYPLDAHYAKEMTRTLLATFDDAAQAKRCIDDMIDGGVLPAPTAIRSWARMHGAQRPADGAANGAGWRRPNPNCPECGGNGVVDVSGVRTEGIFAGMPWTGSKRCECRKVGVD